MNVYVENMYPYFLRFCAWYLIVADTGVRICAKVRDI